MAVTTSSFESYAKETLSPAFSEARSPASSATSRDNSLVPFAVFFSTVRVRSLASTAFRTPSTLTSAPSARWTNRRTRMAMGKARQRFILFLLQEVLVTGSITVGG